MISAARINVEFENGSKLTNRGCPLRFFLEFIHCSLGLVDLRMVNESRHFRGYKDAHLRTGITRAACFFVARI